MTIIPVILSGGSGTRLWPLSTSECPKQFLPLISEKTMIQETLLRLKGLDIKGPVVVCNKNHRFVVAEQVRGIFNEKPVIMLEPVAKNTAPAIAAACCAALKIDKDAVVIVLPSDASIADVSALQKAVKLAAQEALNGSLVTFGIVPTAPETGYGYVKTGTENNGVFNLERFVEKPDLETAKSYLADGNFSWNSGMFVFKPSVFLDELKAFEPEMYELSTASYENAEVDSDFIRLDLNSFEKIKGNSIDYAVMEKTSKGKVVKLDAGWSDVGSWSALWQIKDKNSDGNVVSGNAVVLDTRNSYINSSKRVVAAIGLDDVVIVDSDDAVLVAAKDKVQNVKIAAEEYKKIKAEGK